MDSPDKVLEEILSLKDFFLAADKALEEGTMTNMSGVNIRISDVCKAAQSSPTEKQKEYLPELNSLISLLNNYELSLREYQALKISEVADMVSKDDKS